MLIKKLGHCCLLIRRDPTDTTYVLTDPGNFSTAQDTVRGIDTIVITHEHADHFHTKSLQQILKNNPEAKVVTNESVGKQLEKLHIPYAVIPDRETIEVKGVSFQAFEAKHEEIFEEIGQVQNTAFLIAERLLLPGDSYFDPGKSVDILALPVAGPWCKISDAIRYALKIKPRMAFPIHDGMLQPKRIGAAYRIPEEILRDHGIDFITMGDGQEHEFFYRANPSKKFS